MPFLTAVPPSRSDDCPNRPARRPGAGHSSAPRKGASGTFTATVRPPARELLLEAAMCGLQLADVLRRQVALRIDAGDEGGACADRALGRGPRAAGRGAARVQLGRRSLERGPLRGNSGQGRPVLARRAAR